MMILPETLEPGRFWNLYNRLKGGQKTGLAVVGCAELGGWLDRLVDPGVAQLIFQNGGGNCDGIRLQPEISDLLVLHHRPCAFQSQKSPQSSLLRAWRSLCRQGFRQRLAVHCWLLDESGELLVLDLNSGLLRSPIQLTGA